MEYPKPEILDKESPDSRNGIQVHDRTQTGKRKESKHSLHWTGRTIRFSGNKVTQWKLIRSLFGTSSSCHEQKGWTSTPVYVALCNRGNDCWVKKQSEKEVDKSRDFIITGAFSGSLLMTWLVQRALRAVFNITICPNQPVVEILKW